MFLVYLEKQREREIGATKQDGIADERREMEKA